MPCGHHHHKECLSKWLKQHNTCPVCRSTVEADETPRPTGLHALLQGWREARAAAGPAASATGTAGSAAGSTAARGSSGSGGSGSGGSGSSTDLPAGLPPNFGSFLGELPVMLRGAAPASAEPPPPPPTETELLAFSVAELKARLQRLGVDTAAVVDKRELQEMLRRHSREARPVRVQVHMEVLQLPGFAGGGGIAGLQAAMQAAAASASGGGASSSISARPAQRLLERMRAVQGTRSPSQRGSPTASAPAGAAPAPRAMARSPPAASAVTATTVEAAPPSTRRRRREADEAASADAPEPRQTRQRTRQNQ